MTPQKDRWVAYVRVEMVRHCGRGVLSYLAIIHNESPDIALSHHNR